MIYRVVTTILVFIATVVAITAVVPEWREKFRALASFETRKVLASVKGDLTGHGDAFIINKIQEGPDIVLEVYQLVEDSLSLVTMVQIQDAREAYFTFMGEATNLALANFDEDTKLEIVAPTYDKNYIARLNIFKFDHESKSLIRIDPKQILGFE